MSDTRYFRVGPWNVTVMECEPISLQRGEIKAWASKGGERNGEPYVSRDLLSAYWTRAEWATDRLELELRVSNGEMAGVGLSVALPKLGAVNAKVGVPRRLIKPWVLDSRTFGITLGSYKVAELRFAHEPDACGMRSYYQRKRDRGEDLPHVGRWALVQGLRIGWSRWRWANVLLGKSTVGCETLETGDALVPMPEGVYPATWKRERMTWRRSRVPFALCTRDDVTLDIKPGIPVPGKGENSWDCEDDAVFGTGGRSVSDAIGHAVQSATRQRQQYAGPNWKPTAGWPEGIQRQAA